MNLYSRISRDDVRERYHRLCCAGFVSERVIRRLANEFGCSSATILQIIRQIGVKGRIE